MEHELQQQKGMLSGISLMVGMLARGVGAAQTKSQSASLAEERHRVLAEDLESLALVAIRDDNITPSKGPQVPKTLNPET